MNAFAAFILGLLVGWLIEWIIDWLYWRRRRVELQKSSVLEVDNPALNRQLSELKVEKTSLEQQLEACRAGLNSLQSHAAVVTPTMAFETAAPVVPVTDAQTVRTVKPISIERDDLIIIKGIGPVINRKLNEAGIYTFKQLAEITPVRLREIVGDIIEHLADEDVILAQAKELAAKKESGG